jgi:hypothetical protein
MEKRVICFLCPSTRRLLNFSSTHMRVRASLSNLWTGYVW